MGGAQPEAVFDAVARLPYSIVVTALQGETRRTLSDAQHRSLEAPRLPVVRCSFFSFFMATATKQSGDQFVLCAHGRYFSVNCENLTNCVLTFDFIGWELSI